MIFSKVYIDNDNIFDTFIKIIYRHFIDIDISNLIYSKAPNFIVDLISLTHYKNKIAGLLAKEAQHMLAEVKERLHAINDKYK